MKNNKKTISKITFLDAVKSFWTGYVDFTGCATRRQYWYGILFVILLNILVGMLFGGIIGAIIDAIMFLPIIAMTVRRYRDAGISWWFYVVPVIVFTVWTAVRDSAWTYLMQLDYFAPDMIVFMVAALCFCISNIVICCMPSQQINQKKK